MTNLAVRIPEGPAMALVPLEYLLLLD